MHLRHFNPYLINVKAGCGMLITKYLLALQLVFSPIHHGCYKPHIPRDEVWLKAPNIVEEPYDDEDAIMGRP